MYKADIYALFQSGAKGGKVLSLLHEQTTSYAGDPTRQELCLFLTQKACTPYMEILEKWVYKGIICDPYEEVRFCSVTVFDIPLKILVHSAGFHFLMGICILNKILLLFNNV
jgi:hypothetical protein